MRGVTAVPMHAAMGAILGYYVAQQRLFFQRGAAWSGLAIATLIHGLYDFGPMVLMRLGADEAEVARAGPIALCAFVLFVAVVATTLLVVSRLVNRLRAEQLRLGESGGEGEHRIPSAGPNDPLVAHLLERKPEDAAPLAEERAPDEGSPTKPLGPRTAAP